MGECSWFVQAPCDAEFRARRPECAAAHAAFGISKGLLPAVYPGRNMRFSASPRITKSDGVAIASNDDPLFMLTKLYHEMVWFNIPRQDGSGVSTA